MSPIGITTSNLSSVKKSPTPKLWLLILGVSQYQDTDLPNLTYPSGDCQGLAKALVEATQGLYSTELKIYHDFSPLIPTLENILTTLEDIRQSAQNTDTILFYFSGHGIVDNSTQQVFLCLQNTKKSNLLQTALPLPQLLQLLNQCAVKNQLIWLDACHSGGMTLRGANPTPQLIATLQKCASQTQGFYALLSCDNHQQSWEFPELGHGVFTYFLMQGLQGAAADNQGQISIDSLYRYVYHKTLQYIDKTNQQIRLINQQKRGKGEAQLFQEYPLQTPKRIVEGVGEFILAKKAGLWKNSLSRRCGLLIEGRGTNSLSLDISKKITSIGQFKLEYLSGNRLSMGEIPTIIETCCQTPELETVLIYLRGKVSETETGEYLIFGNDIFLKRSWLKQILRHCHGKQIIILDIIATSDNISGQIWVDDLQIDSQSGQCIMAAISPPEQPDLFAEVFLDTLQSATTTEGLSAAGAIAQLQLKLAGSSIPLNIWLSGSQGIIEILPPQAENPEENTALDLGVCPYMGLSAFSEADSQYFYGRETLTQQIIHHLTHHSLTAVIGASGSGKSSLIQAGVIPQLRHGKQIPHSQEWFIATMRPGATPLVELAKVLPASSSLLEGFIYQGVESFVYWLRSLSYPVVLLFIDQFEELFTLCPAPEREKFIQLLLGIREYAGDRCKIIITLRADFIASCLEFADLATVLQTTNILVSPTLTLDDYRRVIINPSQQVGLRVEPELVEVLLRELNSSPGDLPLLEFVLEQLWQNRVEGELTLQVYQEKLGGLQGTLELSCQQVYGNLEREIQDCAKWIFLSLTQLGEGTEDTRRRVYKSELIVTKYPQQLVEQTLNILTAAKLIVMNVETTTIGSEKGEETANSTIIPSNITVEVAHEILIRHWSTLRWWLEENRSRLRSQRQIAQAAQLWYQHQEQPDFLLQGVRLAEAEDIYIKYTDELSQDVQQYIAACLAQRKQQQFLEKQRLKQAQRAVVALSIFGVVAVSSGGLAYWQSREAVLREIQALNSSAQANLLSHQQLEALLTSVRAAHQLKRVISTPQNIQSSTINILQRNLNNIQEKNRILAHDANITSIDISSNGQNIASASDDGTWKLWTHHGKLIQKITAHQAPIKSLSFSPDGEMVATASFDKTVKLWRVRDGSLLRSFTGHQAEVLSVAWSRDGQFLASSGADNLIQIWQPDNGNLVKTITTQSAIINSITFSPDSQTIAAANSNQTLTIWRVKDGNLIKTIPAHSGEVYTIAFSPDGQTLASGSADKTIKIWQVRDSKLIHTFTAHSAEVKSVNFSPDGQSLVSGSLDSTIKVWNLADGTLLENFSGHSIGIFSVKFFPNGQNIISGSADKTIRIWQRNNPLQKTLTGHTGEIFSVNFHPQGNLLATGSSDTNIKLWNIPAGNLRQTLLGYQKSIYGHSSPIYSTVFSPQGDILASASKDYYIKLWRVADGYMIKTLQGHEDSVNSLSFSPDGKFLASGSDDQTVKIWQVYQHTLVKTFRGHNNQVLTVSFHPQGHLLASGSRDNTIKIWRVADGKLLQTLTGHSNTVNGVVFHPQGKILASASSDKTVKLWYLEDIATAKFNPQPQTLTGHSDSVWGVNFSPDGEIIASASSDKTVKLWNLAGQELKTLQGHSDTVFGVALQNQLLASVSFDGTGKLWQLNRRELQTADLDHLLVRSCRWLGDYLDNHPQENQPEKVCP
ncbi:nSTAND1 domain-containing NTPase [Calothrix sp. 336/3]|uniref:nSTAND1 domain-containing NTPase n=1 Tax=Calothrix sp. 336/3 TaxID=1337936 RepID=UPI0004E342D5|nr:caspase family protein [Calothrix sp. 336/3]AKG20688.1 hypothetical protein IJ00_04650 [Calothrix sp. 336/3]